MGISVYWSTARCASSGAVSAAVSAAVSGAISATPTAVTAASSVFPSSTSTHGPASGSAPGTGLLLGSLGRLVVEQLELLRQGVLDLGVPEFDGLLSHRGFANSPHEGALLGVCHCPWACCGPCARSCAYTGASPQGS